MPDGTVRVLVEGEDRAIIEAFTDRSEFIEAYAAITPSAYADQAKAKKLAADVSAQFETYGKLNKKIAEEVVTSVAETKDPSKLTDIIAVHLNADIPEKQELLEEVEVTARLNKILDLISGEASVLKLSLIHI